MYTSWQEPSIQKSLPESSQGSNAYFIMNWISITAEYK
jgi:hypothetical protein